MIYPNLRNVLLKQAFHLLTNVFKIVIYLIYAAPDYLLREFYKPIFNGLVRANCISFFFLENHENPVLLLINLGKP